MITATLVRETGLTVVEFEPEVDDLDEVLDEAVRRLQVQTLLDGMPDPAPTEQVLVAVDGSYLGTATLAAWGGWVYTPAGSCRL
jgi:hypothetical protein